MIQTRPAEAAVPAKTTRDVLLHAALLIEERGWCQNVLTDAQGHRCAWGAIADVADWPSELCHEASEQFAFYLSGYRPRHRDEVGIIAIYNDKRGRTAAEVIAALRAAADSS